MTESVTSAVASPLNETGASRGQLIQDRDQTAFKDLMSEGLGTLSQRPNIESTADQLVTNLSGTYAGEVGQVKAELLGGEAAKIERSTEASNESLEDRIKNLYTELTHYQIAWKIAQNVQRDISQVLRGS